jgi:hypothetical protein
MHPRRDKKKARQTLVVSALTIFLGEILAGFLIDRAPLEIRFPEVPTIIGLARQRSFTGHRLLWRFTIRKSG